MSELSPHKKRPAVLTRLRIDEVSMVDRGAGANCRVIISKRDDSADDHTPLSDAERERAEYEGRAAIRDQEDIEKREYERIHGTGHADHGPADDEPEIRPTPADDPSRFYFDKSTFLRKSYAAVAAGDEASGEDEAVPVDQLDDGSPPPPPDGAVEGVPDKSITFDVGDKTITARDERALARWLSVQERIQCLHKSTEDSTMNSTDKLQALAKREGVHVICKIMVADQRSYGITQDELVAMISNHERKEGESAAKCFSRHYEADTADGLALRKAVEITKNAPLQGDSEAEADAAAACRELQAIGNERWPSLTPSQRFARAAETTPQILKRAHRRPSPISTFPFPLG